MEGVGTASNGIGVEGIGGSGQFGGYFTGGYGLYASDGTYWGQIGNGGYSFIGNGQICTGSTCLTPSGSNNYCNTPVVNQSNVDCHTYCGSQYIMYGGSYATSGGNGFFAQAYCELL